MGVVARQTLKKSIIMAVGVLLGTVSTLFIYPLDLEIYGNIQFIVSAGGILLPFGTLGISSLVVRFYPEFKSKDSKLHGFLGLLYLLCMGSIGIFTSFLLLGQEYFYDIIHLIGWHEATFRNNLHEIIGLVIGASFIGITEYYLTNFQRVVVPAILNGLLVKILVPTIVLLSYFSIFTTYQLKWLFVFSKYLTLAGLIFYVWQLGVLHLRIDRKFLNRNRVKEMGEYAMYGVLGSASGIIAFQIDTVMVAAFTDFTKTGIYTIALFIANILVIPSKSINPLVGAQIAQCFAKNEIHKISELYKKTSLTLIIIGLSVFLIIWWNIDDIFSLTPQRDDLMTGKDVVLYIGIAKLIDMVMGLNSPIIAYSKYYRWDLIFMILMGVLTVSANMYFIPKIGFTGAALATLISLTIFNLLKLCFIWVVFKVQPFDWNTLKVIILAVFVSLIIFILPETSWSIFNIGIRSLVILIFFAVPIYYYEVSPDINKEADRIWHMTKRYIGR